MKKILSAVLLISTICGCVSMPIPEHNFSKLKLGMTKREAIPTFCGGTGYKCPPASDIQHIDPKPEQKPEIMGVTRLRFENIGTLEFSMDKAGNEVLTAIKPDEHASKYFRLDPK